MLSGAATVVPRAIPEHRTPTHCQGLAIRSFLSRRSPGTGDAPRLVAGREDQTRFHGAIISLPLPLAANSEFRNSGVHGHLPPGAT
jgi:hypothetical protein